MVESLQSETKNIKPSVNMIKMKEGRSIFDNEVFEKINGYNAKKYLFGISYTSLTEKGVP